MTITFFRMVSPPNKLTKTMVDALTVTGDYVSPLNFRDPVIRVYTDARLDTYNYFQIPDAGYYYMFSPTCVAANVWEVSGHRDVLTTYADTIRQQMAVISRQEIVYNMYINDPSIIIDTRRKQQLKEFPQGFHPENPQILLILPGRVKGAEKNAANLQTDIAKPDNDAPKDVRPEGDNDPLNGNRTG